MSQPTPSSSHGASIRAARPAPPLGSLWLQGESWDGQRLDFTLRVFVDSVSESGKSVGLVATSDPPGHGFSGGMSVAEFWEWVDRGVKRIDGPNLADQRETLMFDIVHRLAEQIVAASRRTRQTEPAPLVIDGALCVVDRFVAEGFERLRSRLAEAEDALLRIRGAS